MVPRRPRFDSKAMLEETKPRASSEVGIWNLLDAYQIENIERIKREGCLLVAEAPGMGKTATAIVATCQSDALPALVICPKATMPGWVQDVARFHVEPGSALKAAITGDPGLGQADFSIVSYEDAVLLQSHLRKMRFKSVILDESHFVKNPKSDRSKAVKAVLTRHIRMRILLTGTPFPNRRQDGIAQLEFIGKDHHILREHPDYAKCMQKAAAEEKSELDPKVKTRLWNKIPLERIRAALLQYGMARHSGAIRGVIGVPFERRVHAVEVGSDQYAAACSLLSHWTQVSEVASLLRYCNPSVFERLFPKDDQGVDVGSLLEPSTWTREREGPLELAEHSKLALDELAGLLGVDPDEEEWNHKRRVDALRKIPIILPWALQRFLAGEKVVLFTKHTTVAELLGKLLPGNTVVYHGRVGYGSDELAARLEDADFLVATMESVGTGVDTIKKFSNTMAIAELVYLHPLLEQAEGRLWRRGQPRAVTCHYFIAPQTTDARVQDVVEDKWRDNSAILDGAAADPNFLGNQTIIYDDNALILDFATSMYLFQIRSEVVRAIMPEVQNLQAEAKANPALAVPLMLQSLVLIEMMERALS